MTDMEATYLGWLKEKIPDPLKMGRFVDFRKNYNDQFYNEKFKQQRDFVIEAQP